MSQTKRATRRDLASKAAKQTNKLANAASQTPISDAAETVQQQAAGALTGGGTKQTRRQRPQAEPLNVPTELLQNPGRMNFVLLMAMLQKKGGTVEFTNTELGFNEDDYKIMFAKSLKGEKLVVSIVSVQSGMLEAPSNRNLQQWQEAEPWKPIKEYQEMPHPFQSAAGAEPQGLKMPSPESMLSAAAESPQERFLREAQEGRVAEQPPMPFAVGDNPATSKQVDLGAFARTEATLSLVETEAAAAAERVERGH